jgi:hypothetical protein
MFFICHIIIFGVATVAYLSTIQSDYSILKINEKDPQDLPEAVREFLGLEYKKSMAIVNVLAISLITLATAYVVFVLKDIARARPLGCLG